MKIKRLTLLESEQQQKRRPEGRLGCFHNGKILIVKCFQIELQI